MDGDLDESDHSDSSYTGRPDPVVTPQPPKQPEETPAATGNSAVGAQDLLRDMARMAQQQEVLLSNSAPATSQNSPEAPVPQDKAEAPAKPPKDGKNLNRHYQEMFEKLAAQVAKETLVVRTPTQVHKAGEGETVSPGVVAAAATLSPQTITALQLQQQQQLLLAQQQQLLIASGAGSVPLVLPPTASTAEADRGASPRTDNHSSEDTPGAVKRSRKGTPVKLQPTMKVIATEQTKEATDEPKANNTTVRGSPKDYVEIKVPKVSPAGKKSPTTQLSGNTTTPSSNGLDLTAARKLEFEATPQSSDVPTAGPEARTVSPDRPAKGSSPLSQASRARKGQAIAQLADRMAGAKQQELENEKKQQQQQQQAVSDLSNTSTAKSSESSPGGGEEEIPSQILVLNGKEYDIVPLGDGRWISKNEYELMRGLGTVKKVTQKDAESGGDMPASLPQIVGTLLGSDTSSPRSSPLLLVNIPTTDHTSSAQSGDDSHNSAAESPDKMETDHSVISALAGTSGDKKTCVDSADTSECPQIRDTDQEGDKNGPASVKSDADDTPTAGSRSPSPCQLSHVNNKRKSPEMDSVFQKTQNRQQQPFPQNLFHSQRL